MNDTDKECYGTMFPDALHYVSNTTEAGKVFKFRLEDSAMGSRADRRVIVDMDEWRDCLKCPAFDHCYKLCMAQMELECAVASQ